MKRIFKSSSPLVAALCKATLEDANLQGYLSSLISSAKLRHLLRYRFHPLSLALMLAFPPLTQAEPVGGVLAVGSATFGSTNGQMVINQVSPNVIVNWQSFGIKAGESVRFLQPGTGSVALNRVIGGEASAILGSLTSNGQVFLINPNGILFGSNASVNVGGHGRFDLEHHGCRFHVGPHAVCRRRCWQRYESR
jgi:filamentous hemagglutinin family protein